VFKKLVAIPFLFLSLFVFVPSSEANSASTNPEEFVKSFYQEFFKDYFKILDQQKKDPYSQRLELTKAYFAGDLYFLLKKEDQNKRISKSGQDYCGILDFDPFMDAQDDAGPVKSTQLIQKDAKTQVKVTFANFGGNHSVLVDLKKEGAAWKIENFIYPPEKAGDKEFNLIGTLKELEKEKCK